MKIAYLSGARIPSTAANSVQSVRMCEAFAALGHEVTLYARHGDEETPDLARRFGVEAPFRFVSLPQRGPRGLHTASLVFDIWRHVRRSRPDALFARDVFMASALLRRDLPLVYDVHHIPLEGSIHDRLFARLTRRPGLRRIACITRALKAHLRERYRWLRDEDVVVLPNGAADPTRGDPPVAPALAGPGLKVGYVGHLYEGRGIEQIVEAARRLPDLTFHLIGGRDEDLRRWRAGMPPNVAAHGYVPHGDLGSFYAGLDLLVAPYGRQVFDAQGRDSAAIASPMKLFEYMATGKAILSTTIPGVTEVMESGRTGLLVPPGDTEAFVAALARLAADADLRRRLGEAARAEYLASHTWLARAAAALRLYDEPAAGNAR